MLGAFSPLCYAESMISRRALHVGTLISLLLALLVTSFSLEAASILPRDAVVLNTSESLLGGWDFSAEAGSDERQAYAEKLTIKLQTIGPGDAVWEWFGHSAIVVEEPGRRPVMFDYGIFDLDSDNFFVDFARGRMPYRVISSDALWRQDWSAETQRRDVRTVELDLSPEMKLAAVEFLAYNTTPENSTYLYHYYYDNCSTRIRDIFDAMTDGEFGRWARSVPGTGTYREHVRRHSYAYPVLAWLLDYLQGGAIDRPLTLWDEMFLPEVLEQAVHEFPREEKTDTSSFSGAQEIIFDTEGQGIRPEVAHTAPLSVTRSLAFGIVLAAVSGALHCLALKLAGREDGRVPVPLRLIYGIPLGLALLAGTILSLLLLFLMLFSTHDVAWWNENIVFINPLLIIPAVQAFRIAFGKKQRVLLEKLSASMRAFSIAAGALIILKCIFPDTLLQMNWNIMASVLPLYIALGWLSRPKTRRI